MPDEAVRKARPGPAGVRLGRLTTRGPAARHHLPGHDDLQRSIDRPRGRPFASDLVAGLSKFRSALDAAVERPGFDPPPPKRKKKDEPWPVLPPADALRTGIPFLEVLRQGVREALRTTLMTNLALPIRARLGGPVCWYGAQEAYWIAYYDACQRLGLARYRDDDYDDWANLARSCGWWWPDEDVCVITDRPAVLRMEPLPGAWHEERRLSYVEYRDGWTVHSGSGYA
jgi:Domain of unknown function (DUF6745)